MLIHVCFCGPPGTFKTSSGHRLVELYPEDAQWEPRYNTAKRRRGELEGTEYKYDIPDEEFDRLVACGFLLDWNGAIGTTEHPDGTITRRGTSHPKHWSPLKSRNGFRVSIIGPRLAWQLAGTLARNMTNIYLDGSPDIILGRVGERYRGPTGDSSRDHWGNIERYRQMKLVEKYRHVINTDGLTPDEVVKMAIKIAGLPPPKPARLGVQERKENG